jgi:DNA-binding GntR family transcriptional regulator
MFPFFDFMSLDLRSTISESKQIEEKIFLLIQEHSLDNGDTLPSIEAMSKNLHVNKISVKKAYENLIEQRLVMFKDGAYVVSFKRFSHDYYGGLTTILDLIRQNGFKAQTKKMPSQLLSNEDVKKRGFLFDVDGPFHVMRIDYFADDITFAVTYSYVPKQIVEDLDKALSLGEDLNQYFKKVTSFLRPVSALKALIYPKWVAKVLNVPEGRAGLLIRNDFYDDQQKFIHTQELYVNHFYEVFLSHKVDEI